MRDHGHTCSARYIHFMVDAIEEFEDKWYDVLGERRVKIDTSLWRYVVVDNLPVAPAAKAKKMQDYLVKKFSKLGELVTDTVVLPMNAEGTETLGFAFLEFSSKAEALDIATRADNALFDKKRRMRVTNCEIARQYDMELSDSTNLDGNVDSVDVTNLPDLWSWLVDDQSRDQFMIRYMDETEIMWNDPLRKTPGLANNGRKGPDSKQWTDSFAAWSPRGTFVATFHQQGVAIWGGPEFSKISRVAHAGVIRIEFSPCERYMVTFNADVKDPEALIVWEVLSGRKLRSFPINAFMRAKCKWPLMRWSPNGEYIAAMFAPDRLNVYELPSMVLSGQSLKIKGLVDFAWSPVDNVISYWYPVQDEIPAAVTLIEFPSRTVLRSQFLYQVEDVAMNWHPDGNFLAVKVTMIRKEKKKATCLNMFRIRDKDVPVDTLDIECNVVAFNWEPSGTRFAFIDDAGTVSFQSMKKTKVKEEFVLKDRSADGVFWSPMGGYCVLSSASGPQAGGLEFVSANSRKSLAIREHQRLTGVEWDPSGRFVITSVTQPLSSEDSWKFAMNNGYCIWNMNGDPIFTRDQDKVYQVKWRPRPKSLLTVEQKKVNLVDRFYSNEQ